MTISNAAALEPVAVKNLVDKNKALAVVSFQRPPNMKYQQLKQICKALVKGKVSVNIIDSSQKELFKNITNHLQRKYDGLNPPPAAIKRPAEFETVTIPVNSLKKLKFYTKETGKITQMLASSPSLSFGSPDSAEPVIPQAFALILEDLSGYEECNKGIVPNKNFSVMNTDELQCDVASVATKFANSVIKSKNGVFFLVTSMDVFIHNNKMVDDCAVGISASEYHASPVAVNGGSLVPFLGSSLIIWQYDALQDGIVYIAGPSQVGVISSERLLNQYRRQNSHSLWGFHTLATSLRGFTPINPLHLRNHPSQKNKEDNIYHLSSELLFVASSPTPIKQERIQNLFSLLTRCKVFKEVCPRKPSNSFSTFNKALKATAANTHVFLKLIISIACVLETKAKQAHEIYPVEAFESIQEHNSMLLNIMKSGLKQETTKSTAEIIKAERRRTTQSL